MTKRTNLSVIISVLLAIALLFTFSAYNKLKESTANATDSGQVEELQSELGEKNARIHELEAQIELLSGDAAANANTIADLYRQIHILETQIAGIFDPDSLNLIDLDNPDALGYFATASGLGNYYGDSTSLILPQSYSLEVGWIQLPSLDMQDYSDPSSDIDPFISDCVNLHRYSELKICVELFGSSTWVSVGDFMSIEHSGLIPLDAYMQLSIAVAGNDYTVNKVSASLFNGCAELTSVVLPAGITEIGAFAFEGCSSLTSLNIPASVQSIGARAFYQSGLTSIVIPAGITSVAELAFFTNSLTTITLPASITSIGRQALGDNITTINFCGTEQEWQAITKGADNSCLATATINYNYVA